MYCHHPFPPPRALSYPTATNSFGRTNGALEMGMSGSRPTVQQSQLSSRRPSPTQCLTDDLDNCKEGNHGFQIVLCLLRGWCGARLSQRGMFVHAANSGLLRALGFCVLDSENSWHRPHADPHPVVPEIVSKPILSLSRDPAPFRLPSP